MEPDRRRPALLALVALFALAFALRVGVAAKFQGLGSEPSYSAQPDQLDYEKLAHHLATGEGYSLDGERPTAMRPPGTAWALLPPYLALGRDYAAARVWLALLSSATCVVVALFAARAFGRGPALLAATWLALYPGSFYYPSHFLSETPYGLWLALAALAALRAGDAKSAGWAFGAGLALGLATLTRPQALLVVPLALAVAGCAALARKCVPWRVLLVGCIGFALALAPWLARNQAQFGKLSVSSIGGATFWGANNERVLRDPALRGYWVEVTSLADDEHPLEGGEFEVESACWRYGMEFVREHAREMPVLLAAKLWTFLRPFEPIPNPLAYWIFGLAWLASVPLVLCGLWLAWRERRSAALVLLLPLVATLVTVLVFYGSGRFRDSVSPMLAPAVGLALARITSALRRRAD